MLTVEQVRELGKLILEQESALRAKMHKAIRGQLDRAASDLAASGKTASEPSAMDLPAGLDIGVLAQGADELLAVEAAKERMKVKTYGFCVACNGPIGFKRLLALPIAERCLSCQEDRERATPDAPQTVH